MLIGLLILGVIMYGVFAAFGHYDLTVVLGALLGVAAAFANFAVLGMSVQKAVDKDAGGARISMASSYTLRMLMIAAVVVFAIKSPYINYLAAIIPLIFPRIVIMFFNLKKEKSDERS